MATFKVTMREVHTVTVEVEAPEGTATEELMDLAANMQSDPIAESDYEELMGRDRWDVWQVGESA